MTERRALDQKWQELEQAPRGPSAAQLSRYLRQAGTASPIDCICLYLASDASGHAPRASVCMRGVPRMMRAAPLPFTILSRCAVAAVLGERAEGARLGGGGAVGIAAAGWTRIDSVL